MTTAAAKPPTPPIALNDPNTSFFWAGAKAGRLMIQRCKACGNYIHLPRPICSACHSFDLAPAEVSGRGTLYSFTVTYKAFHPFFVDRVPYVIGVVELAEQSTIRLVANIVGLPMEDVRIGMALEVGFEAYSDELTVPVFRPAGTTAGGR